MKRNVVLSSIGTVVVLLGIVTQSSAILPTPTKEKTAQDKIDSLNAYLEKLKNKKETNKNNPRLFKSWDKDIKKTEEEIANLKPEGALKNQIDSLQKKLENLEALKSKHQGGSKYNPHAWDKNIEITRGEIASKRLELLKLTNEKTATAEITSEASVKTVDETQALAPGEGGQIAAKPIDGRADQSSKSDKGVDSAKVISDQSKQPTSTSLPADTRAMAKTNEGKIGSFQDVFGKKEFKPANGLKVDFPSFLDGDIDLEFLGAKNKKVAHMNISIDKDDLEKPNSYNDFKNKIKYNANSEMKTLLDVIYSPEKAAECAKQPNTDPCKFMAPDPQNSLRFFRTKVYMNGFKEHKDSIMVCRGNEESEQNNSSSCKIAFLDSNKNVVMTEINRNVKDISVSTNKLVVNNNHVTSSSSIDSLSRNGQRSSVETKEQLATVISGFGFSPQTDPYNAKADEQTGIRMGAR